MKSKQAHNVGGIEILVLPDSSQKDISQEEFSRRTDDIMENYVLLERVLNGNYEGVSRKKLTQAVKFLEEDMAQGNFGRLAQVNPEFGAYVNSAIENARSYLNTTPSFWKRALEAAAGFLLTTVLGCGAAKEAYEPTLLTSAEIKNEAPGEYKGPAVEVLKPKPAVEEPTKSVVQPGPVVEVLKPKPVEPATQPEPVVPEPVVEAPVVQPEPVVEVLKPESVKPTVKPEYVAGDQTTQPDTNVQPNPQPGVGEDPVKKLEERLKESLKNYVNITDQKRKLGQDLASTRTTYDSLFRESSGAERSVDGLKKTYDSIPENDPRKVNATNMYNNAIKERDDLLAKLEEAKTRLDDSQKNYNKLNPEEIEEAKTTLQKQIEEYLKLQEKAGKTASPSAADIVDALFGATPDKSLYVSALSGLIPGVKIPGVKRSIPSDSRPDVHATDRYTGCHLEGSWGENSHSGLIQAKIDTNIEEGAANNAEFRAEVIYTNKGAKIKDDSSQTGINLGGGFSQDNFQDSSYEHNESRTALRAGGDIPLRDNDKLKLDLRSSFLNKTTTEKEGQAAHITGPSTDLWTRTKVDNEVVEEGSNVGLSARYFLAQSGKDGIELGALLKNSATEIERDTTINTDGSVTRDKSSDTIDATSYGLTVGFRKYHWNGRANLLWNTGDDVSKYSGDNFEANFFILGEIGINSALGLDYSNRGGKSAAHATWGQSCGSNALSESTIRKIGETLEDSTDDEIFLGRNPYSVENMRFLDALKSSKSWLFQIGGGQEKGGNFEVRVGQDIETRYGGVSDQNLTWFVAAELGKLEDIVSVMAYYSWTLKNKQLNTGVGAGANFIDNEVTGKDTQGAAAAKLEYKF